MLMLKPILAVNFNWINHCSMINLLSTLLHELIDNLNETNGLDSTMNGCLDLKQISPTHSNYRYDLILFPRILDLCLTYIQESNDRSDMKPTIELFFKRLLYLLETCNFNIQILLNHVFFLFHNFIKAWSLLRKKSSGLILIDDFFTSTIKT